MKRLTSLFLSAVLFLGVLFSMPLGAYAAEILTTSGNYSYRVIDGKYAELQSFNGGDVEFNSDGSYTIPGSIEGYEVKYLGWNLFSDYDVPAADIIIPDTVTRIDGYAFNHYDGEVPESYSKLRSVVIPSSVTYIGSGAFSHSGKLKEIIIPGSVSYISDNVFEGCKALKKVTVKEGLLQSIEPYTFSDCKKLKEVNLPSNVTSVKEGAFLGCTSLKELTVSQNVFFEEFAVGIADINYSNGKVTKVKDFKLKVNGSNRYSKVNRNIAPFYESVRYGTNINYYLKPEHKKLMYLDSGVSFNLKLKGEKVKSWKSLNPKVVKVSKNGKVTALKKGKATLKATLKNGKTYKKKVQVLSDPSFVKNNSYINSVSVNKGKTVKVEIEGKAYSVSNKYKNTSYAKITSKKSAKTLTIKGLKKGTTTLKVTVNGKVLKIKVKVV